MYHLNYLYICIYNRASNATQSSILWGENGRLPKRTILESKTREEDFWSISPERDFTQSSRLESDDGDEVVPFKNSSADESVSSSPSPMVKSLRATRQAFGSFEGKFDEGEEVVEHIEDYIPQQRSSSKNKEDKKIVEETLFSNDGRRKFEDHLTNSQGSPKIEEKAKKRRNGLYRNLQVNFHSTRLKLHHPRNKKLKISVGMNFQQSK